MIYFVALQVPFTHGEDGIQAVPRGRLFGVIDLGDTLAMYYFVLAVFLLGFALIVRTISSPFGQVIKAIRENEPRAVSLGYHADHYKLVVFILSAALSGLAGSLKSLVFQLATLTDVEWTMSGWVVLMTLVGGLGTVLGPVVGAFLLVGHGRSGHHLRLLRAGLPPRYRRTHRDLCCTSPRDAGGKAARDRRCRCARCALRR